MLRSKAYPLYLGTFFILLLTGLGPILAQQVPDTTPFFEIEQARYPAGDGPVVFIDAAHHNFHTLDGRYTAFGNIIRADGFQPVSQEKPISLAVLEQCAIYVISNPLHESNVGDWSVPTPSAFTADEIAAMVEWIRAGGSLFLIADHMPFAGAAKELGQAFGFTFLNSYAMDNRRRNTEYFTKASGQLHESPLTTGVDSIVTFTGSAFRIPNDAVPVISFDEYYTILIPSVAWQFSDDTPFVPGKGLHQLAYRQFGKGKVFVSGEAAMFSAQLAGPQEFQMGLNDPAAINNIDLLRQIVAWLGE